MIRRILELGLPGSGRPGRDQVPGQADYGSSTMVVQTRAKDFDRGTFP